METEGRRIYAVGDVHGCRGELRELYRRIAADLAARPHPSPVAVHVGDYVDRGPDSRGVIDDLLRWDLGEVERVCLLGNHDDLMVKFFEDPDSFWSADHWISGGMGGAATLASYGVDPFGPSREVHRAAKAAVPAAHLAFLTGLPRMHRIGRYLFVHAGIRPGVPFERQDPEDLIWIRDEFLRDRRDHGAIVVHGHTPVRAVEVRRNRIGIDTGAVFGGVLSCIVLEGPNLWLLKAAGRAALPRP
ncbi:MAG TPA: metallophosphoesterase family protein [Paracoccaceae bacterium]|nr:metallophosphoesterase family protein [Paracoccaceae bacterium]